MKTIIKILCCIAFIIDITGCLTWAQSQEQTPATSQYPSGGQVHPGAMMGANFPQGGGYMGPQFGGGFPGQFNPGGSMFGLRSPYGPGFPSSQRGFGSPQLGEGDKEPSASSPYFQVASSPSPKADTQQIDTGKVGNLPQNYISQQPFPSNQLGNFQQGNLYGRPYGQGNGYNLQPAGHGQSGYSDDYSGLSKYGYDPSNSGYGAQYGQEGRQEGTDPAYYALLSGGKKQQGYGVEGLGYGYPKASYGDSYGADNRGYGYPKASYGDSYGADSHGYDYPKSSIGSGYDNYSNENYLNNYSGTGHQKGSPYEIYPSSDNALDYGKYAKSHYQNENFDYDSVGQSGKGYYYQPKGSGYKYE